MKLSSVPVDFGQIVFRCGHHNVELIADGGKSPLKPVVNEIGSFYEMTNKWEIDLSDMMCPWWDSEAGHKFESGYTEEERTGTGNNPAYDKEIEACQDSWEMFQVLD